MLEKIKKVPKDSQPRRRFLGVVTKWLASLADFDDDDVVHIHYIGAIFSQKSARERKKQHLHSLSQSGASLLWSFVGSGVCGADAEPVATITASRIIFGRESIRSVSYFLARRVSSRPALSLLPLLVASARG